VEADGGASDHTEQPADVDVPASWQSFIELNREMSAKTPSIFKKKAPLAK